MGYIVRPLAISTKERDQVWWLKPIILLLERWRLGRSQFDLFA
jgi:hypothetical protein